MLYTFFVEHYVELSIALLIMTFFLRRHKPLTRSKLLYFYGLVASVGFLLDIESIAGVILGFMLIELGSLYRNYVDTNIKNKARNKS
ncbi:hypothetical protein O1D97_14880 [Marinomonas sp. 15G1-11]|uniref:Uncharacterized protein n=1 Tax=Marinomonas phaeophyticola TaxID=3004091 RepID=A0ABT4JWW7_9GAMM|nr:hypothetical protein [Marinomonas sp. 15G1-11]MCZ2722857.1 hypothetical protein [Marinomonas sp. 15G1-11]